MVRAESFAEFAIADPASLRGEFEEASRRGPAWSHLDREQKLVELLRQGSLVAAIAAADRLGRRAIGWAATILFVVAAVAGTIAAAAALPVHREQPVNIFLLLGGYLGIQTILLLLWLAAMVLLRGGGPSWGRMLPAVATLVARVAASRGDSAASTVPTGRLISTTLARRLGRELSSPSCRWGIGLISNAAWTAFNVAGVLTAIALLASRQYEFAWESTILSTRATLAVTEAIAWAPPWLGFPVPDAAAIEASRFDPSDPTAFAAQNEATRAAWSGLLLGSMVCYALLPRLVLAAFCGWRRRAAQAAMSIDSSEPAISMLLARCGSEDAPRHEPNPDLPVLPLPHADSALADRPVGPSALAGLELALPATGWPPELGLSLDDLGLLASREDRHRARQRLRDSPTRPASLVIVCDAASTPDRGAQSALTELATAAAAPLRLVITRGEVLRSREPATTVARRLADWRSLAAALGAAVVEVDLDHLTASSTAALRAAIRGEAPEGTSGRAALVAAFEDIVEAVAGWSAAKGMPGLAEEAELHRRIAARFAAASATNVRSGITFDPRDALGSLREAASRAQGLLPAGLRVRPAWLAAGAVAGALGCIAAATVATPLAISALPMWALVGGGLGGLFSTWRGTATAPPQQATFDCGAVVAAAAMQAVLLAHQGSGEDRIGKALAAAFGDDDPPAIAGATAAREWLDQVAMRLAAMPPEGSSR